MIVLLSLLQAVYSLTFRIPDGTKRDSYIGNLPQNANLKSSSDLRQFLIVTGSDLIQIDPTSGDIRTSLDIDRETLCQRLDRTCKFDAEIISTPKQFFQLFKVEIFIDDLNDNSPVFPNPIITLDLAENAKVGTFLRLDSATDADTPKFGIVKYELDSQQDYFKLIQDNIDGSIIPQLELIKPLDYERRPTHTMQLVAVDGGNRSGSAEVIVRVVDVNDHSPVFATDRIECNIPEDLSIGDVVTILNATDGDYGENSRIVYSYQDTLVSEELQKMFKLDPDTGIIKIGEILDFEAQQQHILYIRAVDNGANAVPAYATVVINVLDVNDNRPEIKVSFIGDSENQQSVHYIQEDIAIGEFLAFVSVTDNDANEAGNELQTELEGSDDFELVIVDKKTNRYILQTRKELDRERIETYDLTIRSVDNGQTQRLKSTKNLSIVLLDVNDNAPYFAHGQYHVSVVENNAVGDVVTQLEAQDMDSGENARITYALARKSNNFAIDEKTGEIRATVQLDAEVLTEPELLEIIATDNGEPKLNGTTTLRVSIKDFNDNAPIFKNQKSYKFQIMENLPISFILGKVEAIDGDAMPNFKYEIIQNYPYFPFKIDATTGQIYVDSKLDYEGRHKVFNFEVKAIDSDGLNDTANVTIELLDQNDNAPRVRFPQPSKDIIWISPENQIGDVVCSIKVNDPDSGPNGQYSFEVEGGTGNDLIQLDQNGQMILQRELKRSDYGKYALFVNIVDHGEEPLSTPLRINILVSEQKYSNEELPILLRQYKEELALPSTAGVSQLAMLLVAAFSALVLILLLFTICIFCRYSRRNTKQMDIHFDDASKPVSHLGASINSSRQDETMRLHHWNELKASSDRSYHSGQSASGSCTRDSGAGDSVESEFDHHIESELPFISKQPVPVDLPQIHKHTLPITTNLISSKMNRKPTFTTFMGDSDNDSVQIVDYTKDLKL